MATVGWLQAQIYQHLAELSQKWMDHLWLFPTKITYVTINNIFVCLYIKQATLKKKLSSYS